jgi:hypothetical protein
MTILRDKPSPADPEALALAALGWVLTSEERAERFLALTGLTPDELRAGLGERSVMAAVLEFLAQYEPDMLAAAAALGVEPQVLANARDRLSA